METYIGLGPSIIFGISIPGEKEKFLNIQYGRYSNKKIIKSKIMLSDFRKKFLRGPLAEKGTVIWIYYCVHGDYIRIRNPM